MSDGQIPWFEPRVSSIKEGILYALSYADIYDYPLTLPQLHRYLIGIPASLTEVKAVIGNTSWSRKNISKQDKYYMLPGREYLVEIRKRRVAIAESMWDRAWYFALRIARIPFVRMVALTGALTMNNVDSSDDFDYFIVTERDHLWLARFLIVQLIVKPALLYGEEVCPNYIVTDRAFALDSQNHDLYHAHELAQMVPMYGYNLYEKMRKANAWSFKFLPNAVGAPGEPEVNARDVKSTVKLSEKLLHFAAGKWFEQREMSRMENQLVTPDVNNEVLVTPDQCKGHVGAHQKYTRMAFEMRIKSLKEV